MAFISLQHIIFCILSTTLIPVTLGLGNHITLQEHNKISEYLTKEIAKKYPSDGEDAHSDTLTQVSKGKEMHYHHGDESQPVFLTTDLNNKGKKVIVLKRGEDYITPEDTNTFVVLRQKSGGSSYNVHLAMIYDMGRRQPSGNNSILAWTNGRVEQRANITSSLNLLGNRYLPRRVPLDRRPRCEWVASVLLCNAKKDVQSPQRTFPPKLATSKPDPDKDDLWGAGNGKNQSGGANEPAEESGGDRASGGNNDGDIDESSGVPPGGKGDGENGNNNDGTTDENGGADEKGESGDEGKTKEEEKKPEKNDGDDETTGDLLDEGGSNPETKPDAGGGGGSEERYIPVKGGGEKSKREGKSSMKKKSTSEKKDAKHIKRKPSKKPSGNSVTLNKKYPKKRK